MMRYSLTSSRHLTKGFTLLEILLVLVVMSVMASLLIFSISDNPHKQLDREVQRLQAVVQMAVEEAIMQEQEIALIKTTDTDNGSSGYQFCYLDVENNRWQIFVGKPFGYHALPATISFTVELQDQGSQKNRQYGILQNLAGIQRPQLLIFSSGEISPFSMSVYHSDISIPTRLFSDGISEIERL